MKVNIYSAFGAEGGSTIFFRDLTNKLNEAGYDATFYSPQLQTACKSAVLGNSIEIHQQDDVVISHMIPTIGRVNAKLKILSCHEAEMDNLEGHYKDFDLIHFVSEHQKQYHGIDHPSFICPPWVDKLEPCVGKERVAGIVSHIHEHKQIEKAIELALSDGMEQVLICGGCSNREYFYSKIYPLIDGVRVKYCGPCYNKQELFDSFGVLYSTSISETYSLVISEAIYSGKKVRVLDDCNYLDIYREFNDEVLLNKWISLIEGEVK